MDQPALDESRAWSRPLLRIGGFTVRLHALFLVMALGLVMRVGLDANEVTGIWQDALNLQLILLGSVLCHEFAHAVVARRLGAEVGTLVLWPLGGLTRPAFRAEQSHPMARAVVAMAGPMMHLLLCLMAAGFLLTSGWSPPLYPFWDPLPGVTGGVQLSHGLATSTGVADWWVVLMARIFWINWILLLFNTVVPALPLDGGEALLCVGWLRGGLRYGVLAVVKTSLGVLLVCIVAAVFLNEVLALILGLVIWLAARARMRSLELAESGLDDSMMDLDMAPESAGSWWSRFKERREVRRLERERQVLVQDEARMDALLDKLHRLGRASISVEERRFMERFASRFRERQSGPRA